MKLIIRVPCGNPKCNRLFVIPSMRFATRPRPFCNDCMELDDVKKREDEDGWEV